MADARKNISRKRKSTYQIECSSTIKGTETDFSDYLIDRTETEQNVANQLKVEVEEVLDETTTSTWMKNMKSILLGDAQPTNTPSGGPFRSKKSCYNCNGDHNLAQCPLPKNFKLIAQKKREAGSEIRRRQLNYARITDDFKNPKRFSPGLISADLRNALGIQREEIPEYIYRMRKMGFVKGYPPGYLRKAINNSNKLLKIFEIDGNNKKNNDQEEEKAPELDEDKIICYFGFNGFDKNLIDNESFKIPQFKSFCEMYQNELINIHKKNKKKPKKERNNQSRYKKLCSDSEDDVIVIENEIKVKILKDNATITPKTPVRDENVIEGHSLIQYIGTPIILTRKQDGSLNKSLTLPPIDAFSVGIVPFEAKEEGTQKRGIFKRLMSKLKSKEVL